MAKATQPTVKPDDISFELERFQLDGDQIKLSGRWFGVRGRRFFRPTLTPIGGQDRDRVLADLEHKPWAAEDGERWEAAFPRPENRQPTRFEMSVAPDIAIALPSPGAKLARPRRLAALPRRPAIATSWPVAQQDQEAQEGEPQKQVPPQPSELEVARAQRDALKSEVEGIREAREQIQDQRDALERTLADRGDELEALRSELAVAKAKLDSAANEAAEGITAQETLVAERNELSRRRDELASEREQLASERDRLASERDGLSHRCEELASELDQAQRDLAELRSDLEQTSATLDRATRERDEAVTARGAALVMRRAAQSSPKRSWWRR